MDRWTEIEVFVRIAEEASLTRAGESLGMSVSGVSRYLINLEKRLNVRLVQRSTRQLSLTGEGEQFYAQAREIVNSLLDAEANVSAGAAKPMADYVSERPCRSPCCT